MSDKNRHGLDVRYVSKSLSKLISELDNYTQDELTRALCRIAGVDIEELQAENERLKSELHDAHHELAANRYYQQQLSKRIDRYESTPQRALKAVLKNFGISAYSLADITFFDADLNVIFSVKNDLTADDIKEDIAE